MLNTMSADEYNKWHEYYLVEPFGFPRQEARFATLTASNFGSAGVAKEHQNLATAKHWFYNAEPVEKKPATSIFESMANTYGRS